ncbi:MAG: MOSC domain-containing protein [Phycisphaerae bacterium]
MKGTLVGIFIAAQEGDPIKQVESVWAVPGRGLEGDRYHNRVVRQGSPPDGKPRDVTLIEAEAIEAVKRDCGIELAWGDSRRNLVTRGLALNHFVGRRFQIGEVVIEGVELCEPCGLLERMTQPGVRQALIHRGGLRARIVNESVLHLGDTIEPLDADEH